MNKMPIVVFGIQLWMCIYPEK